MYSKQTEIFLIGTKENFKNIFFFRNVLIIPLSNANIERVFSIMNQKCSKERNRYIVELIELEFKNRTTF